MWLKMIEKVKDLISRHKALSIICLLAFIIIVVLLYIFCSVFVGGNDKYGDRLNGIKEVEISKSELSSVKDTIEKNDSVSSAKVRVQGKIVYIDIIFKSEASKDTAKEVANKSLEEFSKKEKNFYDFEFILTQGTKKSDTGFKITGTKGPKTKGISFIKS